MEKFRPYASLSLQSVLRPMPYNFLSRLSLNANSTRYDWIRAAPAADELQKMWFGLAVVSFLGAASTGIVLAGVLSSRKARSTAFNLYIAGLMVPDLIFGLSCGMTCALNHANHGYLSDAVCEWQSTYLVFGFAGSPWMNAVVAREMYTLLRKTARLEDYTPPTPKTVLFQIAAVYLFTFFIASWTLWGVFPHQASGISGLVCVPIEYSFESTRFFWLAFAPVFIGLPTCYIVYVAIRVWAGMLLNFPYDSSAIVISGLHARAVRARQRQARALTLYFLRIFVVYIGMWLPAVFFIFVLKVNNEWLVWVGGMWAHLQGVVSAGLSLTKPDILVVVLALFGCKRGCCSSELEEELSGSTAGYSASPGRKSFRFQDIWPGMGAWSSMSRSSSKRTSAGQSSELTPSQTGAGSSVLA